jgi:hypothetical protein
MAAEKKRGFGALEQRIHEMEEEDAKKERSTSTEGGAAPRREPEEKSAGKAKK